MNLQSRKFSCRVGFFFLLIKPAINFDFFLLQPYNASSSPQAQISKQRNAAIYLAPELRDDLNSTRKGDYLPSCSLTIAFILGEPWLWQLSMQFFPDNPFYKSIRNHALSETPASVQISKGKTLEGIGLESWYEKETGESQSVLLTHRHWRKQSLVVFMWKYNNTRELPKNLFW